MEGKVAIFPRVVVDPLLLKYAQESWETATDTKQKHEDLMWLLQPCENEYYFIDFMNCTAELGYAYPQFLADLKTIIDTGLTSTDFGVVSKYEWLRKYYEDTTKL